LASQRGDAVAANGSQCSVGQLTEVLGQNEVHIARVERPTVDQLRIDRKQSSVEFVGDQLLIDAARQLSHPIESTPRDLASF
jgi:hypothetical protein